VNKTRVVSRLSWKGGALVKGEGFDSARSLGGWESVICECNRYADEVIFLDVRATIEGREPDYATIEKVAAACEVPLIAGGGLSGIESIEKAFEAGADRVVLNSIAVTRRGIVGEAAKRFGSERIVVAIDARRDSHGGYEVWTRSGTQPSGIEASDWAAAMQMAGAGEIMTTAIERDGTMLGYDLDLIKKIAARVGVPVIASGGAGTYEHLQQAIRSGASAVAVGSMFHLGSKALSGAKPFLLQAGIPVRQE